VLGVTVVVVWTMWRKQRSGVKSGDGEAAALTGAGDNQWLMPL